MSIKRILFITFMFLTFLVLGVGTYVYFNIQNIAKDFLRNEIITKYNKSPDTQYIVTLGEVDLNLLSGSVILNNLNVVPKDSLVSYKSSVSGIIYKSTTLIIDIDQIELSNFDYIKAFSEKIIMAESFNIKSPKVHVFQHQGEEMEQLEAQDTIDIRSVFLDNLNSFNLGKLSISHAKTSFHTVSQQSDTNLIFTISNLSYHITEVFANAKTLYTPEFFLFTEYVLSSNNVLIDLKNGSKLQLEKVDYNSTQNELVATNFSFKPKELPQEFFKSLKYRKAWISLDFTEVVISKLNIFNLIKNGEVNASSLTLENPNLKIYTNANIPLKPNLEKPMLGTLLKSLEIPYFIDSIAINNAIIDMDMIGKVTSNHGKLSFHDLNIAGTNLTNISSKISENNLLEIQAKTKVNQTGNISTSFKINLADINSTTQFNINAKNIDFKAFNSVLKPILRISITDGEIKHLNVSSTLSNNGGIGKMDMHYENLKLQIEGKDYDKGPGFFTKMASGMANGILKRNNIPGDKSYHQGVIKFQKLKEDSFFKMLWLVNLYGIEDSILGSDARDTRKEKKKKKEQDKLNHPSRKKKWF